MLNGLGFLVWKLFKLYPFEQTADMLAAMGVKWLSLKAQDGGHIWNLTDELGVWNGSPALMHSAISIFRSRGIDIGGWGFLYTDGISQYTQGRKSGEAVNMFGLSHWLVDAEDVSTIGARWKTHPDRKNLATSYMSYLNVPTNFPVGLCTYRYLTYHPEFPFVEFAGHYKNKFVAPQVYWMFANNPGFQTTKSYNEYMTKFNKPFFPIGAAFCERGWCPTAAQIREFIDTTESLSLDAYGFWVLEDALEHQDWLDEISSGTTTPPPPPPDPEVLKEYTVNVYALNVRSNIIPSVIFGATPGTTYYPSKVWFSLSNGYKVLALEELKDGNNDWVRVGVNQWMAKKYDNNVYLIEA